MSAPLMVGHQSVHSICAVSGGISIYVERVAHSWMGREGRWSDWHGSRPTIPIYCSRNIILFNPFHISSGTFTELCGFRALRKRQQERKQERKQDINKQLHCTLHSRRGEPPRDGVLWGRAIGGLKV